MPHIMYLEMILAFRPKGGKSQSREWRGANANADTQTSDLVSCSVRCYENLKICLDQNAWPAWSSYAPA